jgi:hypothetical protein
MTYDYGVWIVLRVLGLAFVPFSFLFLLSFIHRTVWTWEGRICTCLCACLVVRY